MRIALVYDAVYPYIKGGAERRIYEIGTRLAEAHEVHLFGIKFWEGPDVIQRSKGLWLHGVCAPQSLYTAQGRRSITQALRFSAAMVIPMLGKEFDIIDTPSAPYPNIYTAKICSVLRSTPLVVSWLEYWGDYWYEYLGRLGGLGKLVEWGAARLPSHIVAISEHTRGALLGIGVPEKKVTVVPCGIDWQMIQDVACKGDGWDLAFVGRLIKAKNVDLLLEVLTRLLPTCPDIRCAIVGQGPEEARLKQLAEKLQLGSHVTFLGRLEEAQEVYAVVKDARIFVTPSRREGFNITALEANACGTPVVTIDHPQNATTDLIENGENGWICTPDPESLSRCIAQALDAPALLEKMSEASLRFSKKFDWDNIAEQTEALYCSVVQGSG